MSSVDQYRWEYHYVSVRVISIVMQQNDNVGILSKSLGFSYHF